MSKPFLSEAAYKATTVIGALLTCLFVVLLFLALLQAHRAARINTASDTTGDVTESETPKLSKKTLYLLAIAGSFLLVLGIALKDVSLIFVMAGYFLILAFRHYALMRHGQATTTVPPSHIPQNNVTMSDTPKPSEKRLYLLVFCEMVAGFILVLGIALNDMRLFYAGYLLILALSGLMLLLEATTTVPRNDVPRNNFRRTNPLVLAMAVLASFFLLLASIILTVVSFRTIPYAHYTYYGPMRIVGFGNRVGASEGVCESIPMKQVAWGGEWGCPHSPSTYCTAYVDSYFCNVTVCQGECSDDCTEDEYEAAKADSEECVESTDLYQDTMQWLEESGGTYNTDEYPEYYASRWNTIYADCKTCEAAYGFMVDADRKEKYDDFLILYGSLGGACAVLWLLALNQERLDGKNNAPVLLQHDGVAA